MMDEQTFSILIEYRMENLKKDVNNCNLNDIKPENIIKFEFTVNYLELFFCRFEM